MTSSAQKQRGKVLEIRDLALEFPTYRGNVGALAGVSLDVYDGEIVGLVGESGCGKSVTAMTSIKLLEERQYRITGGSVKLLGEDVLAKSDREMQRIRGNVVSMIFQEPMNALNPTLRVGRQLTQIIRLHQDLSRQAARQLAEQLLLDMRIPDAPRIMNRYPFELSGGMRQRVMIALAFSCNPRLLIADEPTTALDVTIQAQVLHLLREKARKTNTAVLFITHDLAVVSQLCDRTYVMYAGTIVESGRTRDVLEKPKHPYSKALLQSLPERAERKTTLASIPGTVPNLVDPPAGCRFHPRCPEAHERCLQQPKLFEIEGEPGRRSACWLHADSGAEVNAG